MRIVEAWSSWSPRAGTLPDFSLDAVAAIWARCPTLPGEAKLVLDYRVSYDVVEPSDEARLDALLPGRVPMLEIEGAAWSAAEAWRMSFCEDWEALASELRAVDPSAVEPAKEAALVWERCLAGQDLVTRDEFLPTYRPSTLVGFALHRWLTEAHVDEEIADPLARAVVLGGHWRIRPSKGMLLPAAEVETRLGNDLVIGLGLEGVALADGRIIARHTAGGFATEPTPEPIVRALHDDLSNVTRAMAMESTRPGERWPATIQVLAHRDLPWSTVRPVLVTAALVGPGRVGLVVLANDRIDPLRSLVIHDAEGGGEILELNATTTVQEVVDAVVAREGAAPRLFR
jgi:hypothetical protein